LILKRCCLLQTASCLMGKLALLRPIWMKDRKLPWYKCGSNRCEVAAQALHTSSHIFFVIFLPYFGPQPPNGETNGTLPNICRAFCRLAALVVLGYAVAMTPQTRSSLRIIRISAFALLALLVATMLGWLFLRPATGPAFALTSMNGERFDGSSLTGKPYAMFFGFTHCPDVCPTTMQELADTLGAVGAPAKDFTVLFVSVDPARDTKELMRSYLGAFDPRILGLTGEQTDIDAIVKRNGIVVERVGEGQSYTFNHTASVLLFDKNGQLAGTFSPSDTPDDRKKKLERLLAG
jgi:protein SCO1